MEKIILGLQQISHLAEGASDGLKMSQAIEATRLAIQKIGSNGNSILQELDKELGIWRSKYEVILKEPVGRQGMARHAEHWVEKLKNV